MCCAAIYEGSVDRILKLASGLVTGLFLINTPLVAFVIYRMISDEDLNVLVLGPFVIGIWIFSAFAVYFMNKEWIMTLGVFERIRERRRIAMAAAVAEKYKGIDLFETPEAREIPTAHYRCGNESCYSSNEADKMYWIASPPLSPNWYCVRCTEAMRDMDKSDRLNLDVFLTVLDYEAGQIDKK